MVVFSDRPIVRLEELYGRGHRDAVRKLHDAVEYGYFVAVLGARRIGKTSVVKNFTQSLWLQVHILRPITLHGA